MRKFVSCDRFTNNAAAPLSAAAVLLCDAAAVGT